MRVPMRLMMGDATRAFAAVRADACQKHARADAADDGRRSESVCRRTAPQSRSAHQRRSPPSKAARHTKGVRHSQSRSAHQRRSPPPKPLGTPKASAIPKAAWHSKAFATPNLCVLCTRRLAGGGISITPEPDATYSSQGGAETSLQSRPTRAKGILRARSCRVCAAADARSCVGATPGKNCNQTSQIQPNQHDTAGGQRQLSPQAINMAVSERRLAYAHCA